MVQFFIACIVVVSAAGPPINSVRNIANSSGAALSEDPLDFDTLSVRAVTMAPGESEPPKGKSGAPVASEDLRSDEEGTWPRATTIASAVGALPGAIILHAGILFGAAGLGIIVPTIVSSGVGSYFLLYTILLAAPIVLTGNALMSIGMVIGGLLGGVLDGRLAWPTVVGALLGFVPATAAAALATGAIVLLALNLYPPWIYVSLAGGITLALMGAVVGLSVGPVAFLSGLAVERLCLSPDDDE